MAEFTVNFAGLNIGINSIYDYTYNFCKDYLTDEPADFSVETNEEKIQDEIDISEFNPPRDYAESICIYREIAERLPLYNRFIFHGASISYKDNGYIFTAPSGTGKSTHISLWQKYLDGVEIVNGDKPILHFETDGTITVYSTPYAGKEGWQNHSSAPLKSLCIINRGDKNSIEKVAYRDFLSDTFKQIYKPYDMHAAIKTLELFDILTKNIPLYLLKCDISQEAVRTSFEKMTEFSFDSHCKPSV